MKEIRVEANQTISGLIDELLKNAENEIVCVVPSGARIFQGIVGLKLLKRDMENAKKHIRITTDDAAGESLARRAGIDVERLPAFRGASVPIRKSVSEPADAVRIRKKERAGESEMSSVPPRRIRREPDTHSRDVVAKKKREYLLNESIPIPIRITRDEAARVATGIRPSIERDIPPEELIDEGERAWERRPMIDESETAPRPIDDRPALERAEEPIGAELPRRRRWIRRVVTLFVVGALLVGVYSAVVIAPRAVARVTPISNPLAFTEEVAVDGAVSDIDFAGGRIPGERIEETKVVQQEFPTTSEKELTARSRGSITVTNEYSSSPQTLVATTRFRAQDGKTFRTIATVVIPGAKIEDGKIVASTLDVEVRADAPGSAYNIGPTTFTIPGFEGTPKYEKFTGRSTETMKGGAQGRVKVVAAKDIAGAKSAVEGRARAEMEKILAEKIQVGLTPIRDAQDIRIVTSETSHHEDDATPTFTASVTVTGRALLFKNEHLGEFVESAKHARISEGAELVEENSDAGGEIEYRVTKKDLEKATATLAVTIEAREAAQIDEGLLREQLAGKDQLAVREVIANMPGVKEAEVTFWPFWVRSVPNDVSKITVKIQR
ncbi:MAG: hypothetical protein HY460_01805 [Parcubacteria group bacterium]|nr:hypothetical protein [Parcubacteria group bacterium]